jgi:hypothetical protein
MDATGIQDPKRLEIVRVDIADEEIISLLEKTVQGAEGGGMRHSLQNVAERVRGYGKGLFFLALYKKGSLAGVVGLCRRKTVNCGVEYDTTHVRYLAVQSAFQTTRAPGHHGDRASHVEESFKQRLFAMFKDPGGSEEGHLKNVVNYVMYAYIESRNERSKNLVHQAGFEYIRSFLTVAFSRFSPERNAGVTRLLPDEEPAMARLLAEQYSDYCFYSDEFAFYNNRYYVMRRDGVIMAGVCAIPARFRVVNVPGVWGWMMMKVLPRIPYFRRLFNPGEFRYLVLSSIYCRQGAEDHLPDLFEAVCAEEGYNTALTWLDDHTDLYETMRTNRRMGALNRMLNAKPGLVYASFSGLSEEEKEKFYDNPTYISGYDFS